jgi:hypothetical protein
MSSNTIVTTQKPATQPPSAPISTRAKIEFVAVILVLALFALGFHEWIREHDARVQAEAAAKQAQGTIVDLQKQRDTLTAAAKQRDDAAAATIAALSRAAAAQTTPKQIAAWLPKQIPVPQPVTVQIPAANPANPAPPAIASIPEADLAPLKDFIVQAKTCAVELPNARQDVSSCQQQLKLAGEQLSAAQNEAASWKKAAKGTFWGRVKHDVKWFAVGAAAGAIAGLAHH